MKATTQWSGWLPGWLDVYRPTVTLVVLGVNDGNAPNPVNYHAVVGALHGIGSKVVWIEPPAGVSAAAVRGVIRSLGVETVPGAKVALRGDGVHPTSYRSWAEDIAKTVG